jgi:two-component system response regulator LytT
MNVIIIEDELRTAKDLRDILEALQEDIHVLAILPSVIQAVKWLNENPAPDLIFSDIQLGDGLSFEIFKEVKVNAPVIFCTAFDQYAIQAFESNSIDYLLKPIEEEMVARSIQKYFKVKEHYGEVFQGNLHKTILQLDGSYKQSLLIHHSEKIIPLKVSSIAYIFAGNGLITLHTSNGQNYFVQYTIEQLETLLNPTQFFRANRQFIVNREAIENIEHYFNRRLVLQLHQQTPVKIIVSRQKVHDFLSWIEN